MKKTGLVLTSVVCGGLLLLGCTTPTNPINIAKKLDSNLASLTTSIKKLDTIDNAYLSNPDIYPITNNVGQTINIKNHTPNTTLNIFEPNKQIPIKKQRKRIISNLSLTNLDDVIVEGSEDNINTDIVVTEPDTEQQAENLTENNTDATTTDFENINAKIYYYNLQPVKYAPRYARDLIAINNEDYLANYITKVRNLYAITNDAIMANTELNNYKDNIITYCVEIKDLNKSIKDGTFIPSSQQVAALNNYIDDIKITIKRIKNCNGDLSDEVDSINKTDVGGITTGIDVINSNYLSVLNHIDTRIAYLKNALTTLEQIKTLLQESQNIIESNPEIENEVVVSEIINQTELDNSIQDNETNINQSELDSEDNNFNNLPDTNITEENIETPSIIETEEKNDLENNNTIQDSLIEDDNEIESNNTNIDTYLNNSNNLDTYTNNKIIENDNRTLNNNLPILPSETLINPTINNNECLNNETFCGIDEDKINTPNGTFQNGIITQNNLNNGVNHGVNGFNSGFSGSQNYPNIYNNINHTNKNVDTYGYNTMIDMINNGTVNNGINTLSISDDSTLKPSMVNSNNISDESCENCDNCNKENNECENEKCNECADEIVTKTNIEKQDEVLAPNTNSYEAELL